MPCQTEEPDRNHVATQRAARLYLYVVRLLGEHGPLRWVQELAANPFAQDDRMIPLLCGKLKALGPAAFSAIVYNARSRESRDLADWWEDHQEADRQRQEAEAKALAAATTPARAPVDHRLVKAPGRLRSIASLPNVSGAVHAELRQIADLIEIHLAKP